MSGADKEDAGGLARGGPSATMPDPVEMLVEEHGKVDVVLDGLEAMAEAHHAKEEEQLHR